MNIPCKDCKDRFMQIIIVAIQYANNIKNGKKNAQQRTNRQ